MKSQEDPEDIQLIKKYFITKNSRGLERNEVNKYRELDEQKINIERRIHTRKDAAPKTFVEKSAAEKKGIEKRLEDSDVALSQLIQFGGELVTNVKLANEKREILRRNFEAIKRDELLIDLEKESELALNRFEEISSKWSILKTIKEPMGLFEELEEQKKRIGELMRQKDDMILQCQEEVKRVDERYELDQSRQSTDIYCLVERVDNQIELIKDTYNKHLELLQQTIEEERKTLALAANRKWNELYEKQTNNENTKFTIQKEKTEFYNKEIARIIMEQEEITRATRIRLERDAEILQLELRDIKNNVIMNSEKLDYNFQVLQKRNVENLVVSNQQKRRVAKINEIISMLKKKIEETKQSSNAAIKKLTSEVLNLHSSITELETKSVQLRDNNEKKYNVVWEINFEEALNSLNKLLSIDKILHEQQLGLVWERPVLPTRRKEPNPLNKGIIPNKPIEPPPKVNKTKTSCKKPTGFENVSTAEIRLLRNIMRKIADRAGFLVEEKLLEILEPFSEEMKNLVRTDNIFNALKINSIEDVRALTDFFLPYSWCPNCSDGIEPEEIARLYQNDLENPEAKSLQAKTSVLDLQESEFDADIETMVPSLQETVSYQQDSIGEFSCDDSTTLMSFDTEDMDKDNPLVILLGKKSEKDRNDGVKDNTSEVKAVKFDNVLSKAEKYKALRSTKCKNHYLVIEPTLVLTALKEYTEKYLNKMRIVKLTDKISVPSLVQNSVSITRSHAKDDESQFWDQFLQAFPENKQKLWKSLEHGLNHYLIILKEREQLDRQCEFLRRQNAELKHLLQKYLPEPDQ